MDRNFVQGERERTAQVVALLKARQLAVLRADHVTGTSLCPPGHAALRPRQAHLPVAQSHSGDVCNHYLATQLETGLSVFHTVLLRASLECVAFLGL